MRKNIIFLLFFGIIGTILRFCYINSVNVKSKCYAVNDKCTAEAMVTMERSTGRILYSKNKDKILPMASTTKIITAIVAIESGFDSARCELPDYKWTERSGYSDEEICGYYYGYRRLVSYLLSGDGC